MQQLYAPWRSKYFSEKKEGCVFCNISQNPELDEQHFVFYRDEKIFGVMNLYPYTPAHLLFIPHQHLDSPELLKPEVWLHLQNIIYRAIPLLYEYGAQGINMGVNIKKSAGAGIAEHLHIHLLPRYQGDTNFMTTIATSRIYGSDFEEIYQKIKTLAQIHLKEIK